MLAVSLCLQVLLGSIREQISCITLLSRYSTPQIAIFYLVRQPQRSIKNLHEFMIASHKEKLSQLALKMLSLLSLQF